MFHSQTDILQYIGAAHVGANYVKLTMQVVGGKDVGMIFYQ